MPLNIIEGFSSFTSPDISAPCKTYYKIVTQNATNKPSNARPLVVVHGGPLLAHNYCTPLQELALEREISSVIFYDQVGCGKSSRVTKDETAFINHFFDVNVAQLKSLLDDLQLTSVGFYLFGHSMGSVLATAYAAIHPQGLKALILANALTTMSDVCTANLQLLKTFPSDVGDVIIEFEENCRGTKTEPSVSVEQYHSAVEIFRSKHFNRASKPSQACQQSIAYCFEVMDVFEAVCGGRVAHLWGSPIADYDTKECLEKIKVPTLVIKGEYDQCLPFCQEPLMRHIPQVRDTTLQDASHMIMDEAPEKVVQVIAEFIAGL